MSVAQKFTLQIGYSCNPSLREKLYPLFETAFGIPPETFQDFYARGFWDPKYTPYTLFDGERAVSNVSIFQMPLLANGKQVRAAGIQSVMTHPDYRGKGLMKQLIHHVLRDADKHYDALFLMTESPSLYERFGFQKVSAHYFTTPITKKTSGSPMLRKMNYFHDKDHAVMKRLLTNRLPLSNVFSRTSDFSSFSLKMYSPDWQNKLHYNEQSDTAMIYEASKDTLKLYDVISSQNVTLDELVSCIPENFQNIEFYFSPDRFASYTKAMPLKQSNQLMLRGKLDTGGQPFVLPFTSEF